MILFLLKLKVSSFEIPTMMHSIPITAIFKITLIISLLLFQFLICYPKCGEWGVDTFDTSLSILRLAPP